ncbi:alpha/beta fold hydrolase [Candidatus Falkowbacteria bacterium]|nr:alpha/beta fold hydrolase [Candidatus Falkowbacteria bacterium]
MPQYQKDLPESELYLKGQNGKAVLIIHGFAINIEQTDLLFKYFHKKGYTVARPIMPGHTGEMDDLKRYGPDDWLVESKKWLNRLLSEFDSVYLIGISFGSNIALRLAVEDGSRVKAVVAWEMPIFFNWRIWFILNIVQPIMQLFGVEYIRKSGPLYRKNNVDRDGAFGFIPVKVAGQIRNFIRRNTVKDFLKVNKPMLLLQAEQSDLLDNDHALKYVCKHVGPELREMVCVPIDNHDINLLDEEGKIITMEMIYNFISKV